MHRQHGLLNHVLIIVLLALVTHDTSAQTSQPETRVTPPVPEAISALPQQPVIIPINADQLPAPGQYAAEQSRKNQDYQRVMELLMPLTPEQIERVIQALDVNERISSKPAELPPAPVMQVENLSLTARTPPVVRLAQGYGASVVFTDNTGQSWPMSAYQGFNDGLFVVKANTISGDQEDLPTVLTIQPTAAYGMGNALVTLKGLETPIVLTIALGQGQVDVRKEFRLALPGPNAQPQYREPLPARVEPALLNVLNGLPPLASAQPVSLQGAESEARAWQVGPHYYIRTMADIYSPAYEQRSSSPSGVHAYKIAKTPVMLASHNGAMTELLIED